MAIVASVSLVKIGAPGTRVDALEELDEEGWELRAPHWLARTGAMWERMVQVKMTGGYADDAAPSDVLFAIRTQLDYARQITAGEKLTTVSIGLQGATTAFRTAEHHPIFAATVRRYRRTC